MILAGPPLCRLISRDVLLEPAEQQVARRPLEGERLLDGLAHAVDPALHDRVEQRVPVREVPVERARADARALGDLVEGGVVPLLAEDRTGDLHDAVVVALRIGTHSRTSALLIALLNGDSLRIVVEEAEPSSGSRVPRPTRPEQDLSA